MNRPTRHRRAIQVEGAEPAEWNGPRWHTNGWPLRRPLWLRRRFPGRWTSKQVADINRRAAARHDEMKEHWS